MKVVPWKVYIGVLEDITAKTEHSDIDSSHAFKSVRST